MIELRFRKAAVVLGLPWAIVMGSTQSVAADRLTMDMSGGAMAATNPYLLTGNGTAGESVFAEITPVFVSENEISTFSIHGYARLEQYLRRFSTDESFAVDADMTRKLSDRIDIRAGGTFRSSRSSAQDILFNPTGVGTPTSGIPAPIDDVATFGQRNRATTIAARAGAGFVLGPRDKADVDFGLAQYRYDGVGLFDYRTATQEAKYTRQLSESTSLYGRASFNETNYFGRQDGDALIISPALGIKRRLSSTVNLSADVGASWTSVEQLNGSHTKSTSFALRGELCSERALTKLCLNAERSSQPTALGRVRTLTRVALGYDRKLSENDRLRVNASYSRTSESSQNLLARPATFVGASADYSHQISKRLALFASSNFADIYETGISRRANLQVRAGLRIHFGAI